MQNISSSILPMNDCAISFLAATQLLQNPLIIYFFCNLWSICAALLEIWSNRNIARGNWRVNSGIFQQSHNLNEIWVDSLMSKSVDQSRYDISWSSVTLKVNFEKLWEVDLWRYLGRVAWLERWSEHFFLLGKQCRVWLLSALGRNLALSVLLLEHSGSLEPWVHQWVQLQSQKGKKMIT